MFSDKGIKDKANSMGSSGSRPESSTSWDSHEILAPLWDIAGRGLIFVAALIVIGMFGGFVFWAFFDAIKDLTWLQTVFLPHEMYALALAVTIFLVVILLIYTFPFGSRETRSKLAGWVVFITIITFLLYVFFLDGTVESQENADFVIGQVEENALGFFEAFGCMFNPACIQKKYTQTEGVEAKTVDYELDVTKTPSVASSGYSREQLIRDDILFHYTFKSVEGINLHSFDCYYDRIDDENKFHTEDLSGISVRGKGNLPIVSGGLECENRELIELEDERRQELRIVGVLNFSIDVKISQPIPAVSMDRYIEEIGLDPTKDWKFFNLKEGLDTFTRSIDKRATFPNIFESVSTETLTPELPLLLGDGEPRTPRFTLTIKENNRPRDFAEFVAGEITGIDLPNTLSFGEDNDYNRKIEFENNVFETSISIIENDGLDIGQTLKNQNMDIYITAHFQRKDTIRIETDLTDEELNQIKGQTQSETETGETNETTSEKNSETQEGDDQENTFTDEEVQEAADAADSVNEAVPITN